jgi:hypothetical protein
MQRRMFDRRLILFLGACALLGCQQQPPPPTERPAPRSYDFSQAPPPVSPNAQTLSPDDIGASDPTATRLQDIGGYVLLYYSEYEHMPASLDDLRSMPGGGDLQFTSAYGQPLQFVPPGLWPPGTGNKCIIAFDPSVSGGKRWCLFMTLPRGGAALSVDVASITDGAFQNYHPLDQ